MDAQTSAQFLGWAGADGMYADDWAAPDQGITPNGGPVATSSAADVAHPMGMNSPDFWVYLVLVAFLFFTRIAYEWAENKPGQS